MAENQPQRERIDVGKWLTAAGLATLLAEGFAKQAEWAEEREKARQEKVAREFANTPTGSLALEFFSQGNLLGATIALALLGWGAKELGDIWKEYGRENFPLDPFTKRGRGAMRSKFREVKNAFKQIGP